MPRLATTLHDQRGMALIMSLIVLVVLSALIVAFSVMSATEPTIANNHMRATEARAIAEAGVEQAIWALNVWDPLNPTVGIPDPLPTPQTSVPSPYNNQVAVPVVAADGSQRGVFRVTVAAGATATERTVESVGWVPTDSGSDLRTKAHRKVRATLGKIRLLVPQCALCVRGNLDMTGNTLIDARNDTSCGAYAGSMTTGTTTRGGSADIYGADGNNTKNEASDMLANQPMSQFDQFTFTTADLDALRGIAKAQGTYYRGAVQFNSGNMPNGLVFVDTVDGQNITASTPTSNFADVDISGNPGTSTVVYQNQTYAHAFKGWLIVNGALRMDGNIGIFGMVYVMNDITYRGTGGGMIAGAVVSQNVRDTVATSIDSSTAGNASIMYDCNLLKTGGGIVPQTWFATGYREVQGQ